MIFITNYTRVKKKKEKEQIRIDINNYTKQKNSLKYKCTLFLKLFGNLILINL